MAASLVSMCTARLSVLLGVCQHAAVLLNVILGGTVLPHHLLLLLPAWRMALLSEMDHSKITCAIMQQVLVNVVLCGTMLSHYLVLLVLVRMQVAEVNPVTYKVFPKAALSTQILDLEIEAPSADGCSLVSVITLLSGVSIQQGKAGAVLEQLDAGVGVVQALLVVRQVALIGVMLVPAQHLGSKGRCPGTRHASRGRCGLVPAQLRSTKERIACSIGCRHDELSNDGYDCKMRT